MDVHIHYGLNLKNKALKKWTVDFGKQRVAAGAQTGGGLKTPITSNLLCSCCSLLHLSTAPIPPSSSRLFLRVPAWSLHLSTVQGWVGVGVGDKAVSQHHCVYKAPVRCLVLLIAARHNVSAQLAMHKIRSVYLCVSEIQAAYKMALTENGSWLLDPATHSNILDFICAFW